MNKNELIAAIAEETGVMRSEVTRVLNAFTDTVTTAVAAGEEVAIPGIGKIKTVARAARTGRNPKTGEAVEIPAKTAVKITPAKALVDAAGGGA